MLNAFDKYLQDIESELHGLSVIRREEEVRERKQHIEAIIARLVEGGLSQDEAVQSALAQFGPPRLSSGRRPRLATRRPRLRSKKMLAAALMGIFALPALPVLAHTRALFVPSGSMEPTLKLGTRILVRHQPYRDASEVRRGDVVVHQVADHGHIDQAVKRVVGLPGDSIVLAGQSVRINGRLLPHANIQRQGKAQLVRETNGSASYVVQYGGQMCGPPNGQVWSATLAPGEFYLLGDNRDNSRDSRFLGPIRFASIVARYKS